MNGTLTVCDECGHERKFLNVEFSDPEKKWITLNRILDDEHCAIKAGSYDFCCDSCLLRWAKKRATPELVARITATEVKERMGTPL